MDNKEGVPADFGSERFKVLGRFAGEPIKEEFIESFRNFMNNDKPKISKLDLRLGNLFEQGIVFKISGRTGAKIHLHGRAKFQKGHLKIRHECFVTELVPIPLTPEVLVEWCGFEQGEGQFSLNGFDLWSNDRLGIYHGSQSAGNNLGYLHELQNLYYALEKIELEIRE